MNKHVLSVLGAVILTLALAAIALAQTTTTVTKTVQNPDGTYTIIEYPVKKEVTLNLTPINVTGAKGVATGSLERATLFCVKSFTKNFHSESILR